jgi:hypothetical protein
VNPVHDRATVVARAVLQIAKQHGSNPVDQALEPHITRYLREEFSNIARTAISETCFEDE